MGVGTKMCFLVGNSGLPVSVSLFIPTVFDFLQTIIEEMSSGRESIEVSIVMESERDGQGMKKTSAYIPGERSGKWSEDEHMKYIIFIDYNKEKMRSKQKRRSNKFYEEMAHFISTRNSLQCRSHHQKLQEKYTHVNKIIALFKPNFNKTHYKKYLEQLDIVTHEKHMENLTRYSLQERTMVDQEIQTDIQDVSCDLVMVNPNLVIIQNRDLQEGSPMSQPMNYQQMPYFQPQLYPSMENPMQAPPPPYPSSQMWWGGYSSNRF